ncbi:hypothetical protein SAMN05444156_1123 [Verrucomicrobium sp. GAS474]|uniref:hypothetical protein n=1 Tax=Verrucomicrobium sp. GAS474 TaxID=1882831 RepID=UPI00087B16D1|nr:hypothetical protein [Verrucomicrobium sp. GAS474]SDT96609.1 hypothetical protein SAMN05444156_1123 [Verrucomicrobium sp. GAS474]
MLDPILLPLLRCPETRQTLTLCAGSESPLAPAIAAGGVVNRGGKVVNALPEAFLVREDGTVAYPVRGGIPLLLVEEGVVVKALEG